MATADDSAAVRIASKVPSADLAPQTSNNPLRLLPKFLDEMQDNVRFPTDHELALHVCTFAIRLFCTSKYSSALDDINSPRALIIAEL